MRTLVLGGTVVAVVLGCGPVDVNLSDDPGEAGAAAVGSGGGPVGGATGYAGSASGYGGAYPGGYGGTAGASGGTCWVEQVLSGLECEPLEVLMSRSGALCEAAGARLAGVSLIEACADGNYRGGIAECCDAGGVGGQAGAAGSDPGTGGVGYGGTGVGAYGGGGYGGGEAGAAGDGGGVAGAGGYGGTGVGGGAFGGTGVGGGSAGGGSAGVAGTSTGGAAGGSGEIDCWVEDIVTAECADNDVFLGRGYERCDLQGATLVSICYVEPCDGFSSRRVSAGCCRPTDGGGSAGAAGAAGFAGTGGSSTGGSAGVPF